MLNHSSLHHAVSISVVLHIPTFEQWIQNKMIEQ